MQFQDNFDIAELLLCDPLWENQEFDKNNNNKTSVLVLQYLIYGLRISKSESKSCARLGSISTSLTPPQKVQMEKSSILGAAKGKW